MAKHTNKTKMDKNNQHQQQQKQKKNCTYKNKTAQQKN